MNVRKPIIAGMMGLTTLAPCKAQKAVEFVAETGITGVVNKEASFYGGINTLITKGKNFSDLYAGFSVQPDKKVSFVGLAINDFAWNKNLSSWGRGVYAVSKDVSNMTLELAPVKANVKAKKFNFSLAPSYALYNDFRAGNTTQGINTIFQTTYNASKKNQLFLELNYQSKPRKNLFDTRFGKFKNNMSYMVSLFHNL